MSLFTSSSKKPHEWREFFRNLLVCFVGVCSFIYGLIVLVDPFDVLPLSLPLDRAPMATNQRFSYPSLIRNKNFDSAVFGSSSIRLFRPELLDRVFSGKFVNLGANALRPYEQYRFLKLFMENHPKPKVVILGVDIKNEVMWCRLNEVKKFTGRRFPEWMYDENPWNDYLHHFNAKALEISGRQVGQVLGLIKPRFGRNGFDDFTPPMNEYDAKKVRNNIYGGDEVKRKPKPLENPEISKKEQGDLNIPALDYLEKMLAMLPYDTIKIIHFTPRHWYEQPQKNTKDALILEECKSRIINLSKGRDNTHLFDFMIKSPLTVDDNNFWDTVHHTVVVADDLVKMIGDKVNNNRNNTAYYDYH